ncbi:type IX secretion system membrane protein PorP/SprF [Pedobacter sp. SYSU D00535]|uniref:PorP/SprF family type IX secretion system membrane protein n=1 Tax=Pedobacter sp. SYSU D00535 TaxID=2810308 RepID=UPI001A96ED33|nr:type IX secretion system membrane protein PorP/SprF [Pedobacter sp. SYSU D00535]
MRLLLPILFALFLAGSVQGQERPLYTQFIFNNYLWNPAITGIENYIDVKAGHRTQWQGLEGAPVTSFVSLHAPLGKNFLYGNATSFSSDGNNRMSRSYTQYYRASEPHHGIGFHGTFDESGPINQFNVNGTYAYHLGLSESLNLSLGVAAGLTRHAFNSSNVELGDPSRPDPAVLAAAGSRIKADLGAGIWFYGSRFFFGVSGQQLLGIRLTSSSNMESAFDDALPQYIATGGVKLFMSEDIAAVPSVLLAKTASSPMVFDANLKLAFQDKFWIGGGYRQDDSFSVLAGFNVSHLLNLSYAYDFTTSDLQTVSNGSHEIILGLLLNNRYKVTCPQRNW